MSLLLPIGIKPKRDNSGMSGAIARAGIGLVNTLTTYLFVNPEKMQLRRAAGLAETRTMGGTVFQPWPNMPDQIEFNGILYGTRSVLESFVLDNSIPASPDDKEVDLIYKWKKYPGYVKELTITADVDRPRVFQYTLVFASKNAMELYRMMLGQLTGLKAESDFLVAQTQAAQDSVKTEALNTMAVAWAAGSSLATGGITLGEISLAAARSVALFSLGNALKVGSRSGRTYGATKI